MKDIIIPPTIPPSNDWPTSTPEKQGMDSKQLAEMLRFVLKSRKNINSILIVRNGYLVTEAYFDPYTVTNEHHLYSATKSITSALVGIAIMDGYIRDVHQKVLDFYPTLEVKNNNLGKEKMTLEHVLQMTTGLDWRESGVPYGTPGNTFSQMEKSTDWVQYILDQPMASEPGTEFDYNSGASHLLSAIIQKETGQTASSYAEERLFKPLGISDFYWTTDPNGITSGGWGLYLTPRDMAKFGYLYLDTGLWNGRVIVPSEWVNESTRRRITVISSGNNKSGLWRLLWQIFGRDGRTNTSVNYGYHWWIPSFGGYAALGYAGQAIYVKPDLNLVVVITSGLHNRDAFLREKLMQSYIIPAVKSSEMLRSNPEGLDELQAAVREAAHSEPRTVPLLPKTAKEISGKTYILQANNSDIRTLSLTFTEPSQARLDVSIGAVKQALPVGLDNVFRTAKVDEHITIALRGYWADGKTFVLDWAALEAGDRVELRLRFDGDRILLRTRGVIAGYDQRITGYRER